MVFNLIVQDDPVGFVRGQPGQAERVGGGPHQVDGGHGRGSWGTKNEDKDFQLLVLRDGSERSVRQRAGLRPFCLLLSRWGWG